MSTPSNSDFNARVPRKDGMLPLAIKIAVISMMCGAIIASLPFFK